MARNIDGDEAAVLGAVLHAASVSATFKLGTENKIKDLNNIPINIKYEVEAQGRDINTVLFGKKAFVGSQKLLTFKRLSDFTFEIEYLSDSKIPVATVNVSGLNEAILKYKDVAIDAPKVKVQIGLTESGIIEVNEAFAIFEVDGTAESLVIKDEKENDGLINSVKNLFNKNKGADSDKSVNNTKENDFEDDKSDVIQDEPENAEAAKGVENEGDAKEKKVFLF